MRQKLIEHLKEVSAEEEKILKSSMPVLSHFVEAEGSSVIDRNKMIRPKAMIDVMKHLRFVDVPEHSHNFLEVSYMCTGSVRHVINGTTELTLQASDLLFLKCGAVHSIGAAGYNDIAINFMILPEFLQYPLNMLTEDTMLRRFIESASKGSELGEDYLHFHLQDMQEAQNLLENMMLSLLGNQRNRQRILQATMGVLFLELTNRTHKITVGDPSTYEQDIVLKALSYIDKNYPTATLEQFCREVNQPAYYISRLMKRYSPFTFTKYLQRRRLAQAAFMLSETTEPIEKIIVQVGYENSSHFHRLFKEEYHMTPREYRRKFALV